MTVHDFRTSLALSQEQTDNPLWERAYRLAFNGFQGSISILDNGLAQHSGVDRVLALASGQIIRIDEKLRATDYDDFCLEYWSVYHGPNDQRNRHGWIAKDLACDYIAYAFLPSQRVYLLPWHQLRRAWRNHAAEWVAWHRRVEARNDGYVTVSVAVPIDEVLNAMRDVVLIPALEEAA